LSIGLQSFVEDNLIQMNRAHSSQQGIRSVKEAQDVGLTNITIDLMYGLPGLSKQQWKDNLTTALSLDVDHISAYCLTIEPKTVFGKWVENNKIVVPKDEVSANQMQVLIDTLGADDYEHYEISNFARKEMYSKHNTAYWQQKKYNGVGPSAHSYNGVSRSWNVSNNHLYVKSLTQGKLANEVEILSEKDKVNEYIMTGLRTKWGINLSNINNGQLNLTEFNEGVAQFLEQGYLTKKETVLTLTSKGKHIADRIASDLFIVD
jgi:oxygen-independent coproporphyrinogen-3 oxidase